MTYDEIVDRLGGVTDGMARCPAHDDRSPSLSVTLGDGERTLLHCHAGCDVESIVQAIGITAADLFPRRNGARARIVARYRYVDERGELLYEVLRDEDKKFLCRRPNGITPDGWIWSLGKTRRVLYNLPAVVAAVADGDTVYVAEGEKDVDTLTRVGVVATTNPHGAGKWSKVPDAADVLSGASVVVVADADDTGRAHARDVASSLLGKATAVTVVEAGCGKDVTDHLAAGLELADLQVVASTDAELVTGQSLALETWCGLVHTLSPSKTRATVQPLTAPAPTEPPDLAHEQAILTLFAADVGRFGVVGEDASACILYLLVTSRLLDNPVSAAVKGHSASGKSFTVESTLRFFPREAYIEMTAMSEKALVYSSESYSHRTLVIYEAVALREGKEDDQTAYFVRSLLSEGRIDYPVTVRGKDGGFITRTITKEGPTNMVVTTTKTRVHAENETRLLSLTTDDSSEQTARVLRAIADEDHYRPDLGRWHDLQRWLQHAEHRVTIPYAAELAELIPPIAVRLRRDFGQVLALIRCHAILHQLNRSRDADGRIVARIDDYTVVRGLVADLVAQGVGATVSPIVRETVRTVAATAGTDGITAAQIATRLDLDKSTVSRRMRMAADGGYIRNLETKRGRPGRWVVGDPMPETLDILPQPCNLTPTTDSTKPQVTP